MSRRRIGFWYRLAALICKPLLVVLFKRDWRGMEHIPAEGGFITVVNHNSYLDPLSYAHFQYNSGRVPRFLAKAPLFNHWFLGMMLRGTRQIPVYRETSDAANAFRAAVSAVEAGECVAVYPEGTLTRDPHLWPMTGKTGAARLALLTGAPVIPVAQWGAHLAMPAYAKEKKLRLFPRKTLRVVAGPPVDLAAYLGQEPTTERLREMTDVIMDAVTALLAELREETPPAERYDLRMKRAAAAAVTGTANRGAADTSGPLGPSGASGAEGVADPRPAAARGARPAHDEGPAHAAPDKDAARVPETPAPPTPPAADAAHDNAASRKAEESEDAQ